MAGWISGVPGLLGNIVDQEGNPLVRDPAGDVLADFHADPVRAQQFLALPGHEAHVFSVAVHQEQRAAAALRKTECGGGDDVDQLVEIERGARLFADGMEEHQLFDFLLGLLVQSRSR